MLFHHPRVLFTEEQVDGAHKRAGLRVFPLLDEKAELSFCSFGEIRNRDPPEILGNPGYRVLRSAGYEAAGGALHFVRLQDQMHPGQRIC